jgi:hypothetical protein
MDEDDARANTKRGGTNTIELTARCFLRTLRSNWAASPRPRRVPPCAMRAHPTRTPISPTGEG